MNRTAEMKPSIRLAHAARTDSRYRLFIDEASATSFAGYTASSASISARIDSTPGTTASSSTGW